MLPNYSGRLLDRLILIAAKQTAGIRQNPDDENYSECRAKVVRSVVKALWVVRAQLHEELREAHVEPAPSKR